ncbi:MAG: hypothetical protein V1934_01130 [Methanobacteriota archaeon]
MVKRADIDNIANDQQNIFFPTNDPLIFITLSSESYNDINIFPNTNIPISTFGVMGFLDIPWIFVSMAFVFSFPGLPLSLILMRKKLFTRLEAIALMPISSISLSFVTMVVAYFGFGVKFGVQSWAFASAIVTFVGALLYIILLRESKESLFSHVSWIWRTGKENVALKMKSRNTWILLCIMALGAIFSLWPKFGYYRPIHTDEWHYWAHAQSMMGQGVWNFQEAYYGYNAGNHAEGGFLLTIGTFQNLSGIDWGWLFAFGPVLISAMTIMACYAIGKSFEAAIPCALLGAMLPTTLRFLGPGFLVPITLGFLLILGLILILLRFKSLWLLPLIIIIEVYALLMHPPTALAGLIIIVSAGFAFILFKEWRLGVILIGVGAASLLIAIFTPFLWSGGVWAKRGLTLLTGGALFLPQMSLTSYVQTFGFWLFLLGFLGLGLLIWERKRQSLTLALATMSIAGLTLAFQFVLNRMQDAQALMDRTTFLFFGLLALSSGVGASRGWKWSKPAIAIVLATAVGMAFYSHANEPYYMIVSEQEFDDFTWIRENLNATYTKAVLDPWKAIAFSPIAEKQVLYKIPQGPDAAMESMVEKIASFFDGRCSNTSFLVDNGISIVYTAGPVQNDGLREVHPRVYVLDV